MKLVFFGFSGTVNLTCQVQNIHSSFDTSFGTCLYFQLHFYVKIDPLVTPHVKVVCLSN